MSENLLVSGVFVEWCNDIDGEFLLTPEQAVIEFSGEWVKLVILIASNLLVLDDLVEYDLLQFGGYFRSLDIGVFYFLLYVFFLVGEVLKKITIALDVGLLFEQTKGFFDALAQPGQILIEALKHQHAEVADRWLEALDVLDQEKRFQHLDGEGVFEMIFRLDDGLLNV